jgi:S1-C subfamily serine protease
MKNKNIFLIIIVITYLVLLNAEEIPFNKLPEALPFLGLQGKVEEKIRNSVTIELSTNIEIDSSKAIGSGFMISYESKLYIITCYHVIEQFSKDQIIIGFNVTEGKGYCKILSIKGNKKSDIAILELDDEIKIEENPIDPSLMKPLCYTIDIIEKEDNIKEGLGIFTIGYPINLGCQYIKNEPIVRIGIVAQRVNNETGTFLIDSICNPGNSGSPVYNSINGKLIGIVSGYKNEYKQLYDKKGMPTEIVPLNSGLSECILAELIIDILREIDNE